MKILPGLCSVTFRQLSVEEIIRLSAEAGLAAIEWGGDIHVPHGQTAIAKTVGEQCRNAGLATPTYGSYFRTDPDNPDVDFQEALDSAVALGASTIRIWAGRKSSGDLSPQERRDLVREARRVADLAAAASCTVAFEYHLNTATDTNEAALALLQEVDHPAVRLYWQPRQGTPLDARRSGLASILPYLSHFHVFQWTGFDPVERHPLAEGMAEWEGYFSQARALPENRYAFLEFVRGDDPEQFKADAAVLRSILEK